MNTRYGASDGTKLCFANLPCLTTQCYRIRYPSTHLLIKKQFTELFFLTFAALLGFKFHHIFTKKKSQNKPVGLLWDFGASDGT